MTNNEIIKALECCLNDSCYTSECFFFKETKDGEHCQTVAIKYALDLINRQKATIEKLKKEINLVSILYQDEQEISSTIKAEAVKEFAERLKTEAKLRNHTNYGANKHAVSYNEGVIETRKFMLVCIDNLVKEMVGDTE